MSAAEERGGPAPFMRDGGRGFGHPGLPGAFRPRPDGARGFARPPMSGGRPELEGFGPYSGDMDRGPRHAGRFQEALAAPAALPLSCVMEAAGLVVPACQAHSAPGARWRPRLRSPAHERRTAWVGGLRPLLW